MVILNNKNIFTEYGIGVENKSGHLDIPKRKPHVVNNWEDQHGLDIEDTPYYKESRELILNCFIKADSVTNFLDKLESFQAVLMAKVKNHLQYNDIMRAYLVYFSEGIKINGYRANKNIGRFQLKLTEIQPHNIQETVTTASVTLAVSAISGTITVNWGDMQETIITATGNYNHNYGSTGNRIVMIYGDIDNLDYDI